MKTQNLIKSAILLAFVAMALPNISALVVNIDMPNSFHANDMIFLILNISSAENTPVNYSVSFLCPDLLQSPLTIETTNLNANSYFVKRYTYMIVTEDIEPQQCNAEVLINNLVVASKTFYIDTLPTLNLEIKVCKDSSCQERSKIFNTGEEVFISYSSPFQADVQSILVKPDASTRQLSLPSSTTLNQAGTYTIHLNYSSSGYKRGQTTYTFNVLPTKLQIKSLASCNIDNSCGPSKRNVNISGPKLMQTLSTNSVNHDFGFFETCDDSNNRSGDGCSGICRIEFGWACSGQPSNCTKVIDVDAPGSVKNLKAIANGPTWITWNWTNPNETDFAHSTVYRSLYYLSGGKNITNPPFNATGLSQGQEETLTVFTADTRNNMDYLLGVSSTASTSNGAIPPGPITSLKNVSKGASWIYWTWKNPTDLDFSQNIIYLNGMNLLNTSNSSYNATGLAAATIHNITIYTMDNSGGINTAGVTNLSMTLSSGGPINGTCGASRNSCAPGTLSNSTQNLTHYLWQCLGSNGGTNASCSLRIPVNFTINVSKSGTGKGNITSNPVGINCGAVCSANYTNGTSVTLTAIPDSTSLFSGWSNGCTGNGVCILTQNANPIATFTQQTYIFHQADNDNNSKIDSTEVMRFNYCKINPSDSRCNPLYGDWIEPTYVPNAAYLWASTSDGRYYYNISAGGCPACWVSG